MSSQKPKILFLSNYYPPSSVRAAFRTWYFAKYFANHHWESFVITQSKLDDPYLPNENDQFFSTANVKVLKAFYPNFSILRNKDYTSYKKKRATFLSIVSTFINNIFFPDRAILWFPFAFFKAFFCIQKNSIKILWSTSPRYSTAFISLVLRKTTKVKWCLDIRDYYFINYKSKNKSLASYLAGKFESQIIQSAHLITFVSNTMLEKFQVAYPQNAHKMHYVPNGIEDKNEKESIHTFQENKLVIAHAGYLYNGLRNPIPLVLLLEKWMAIEKKLVELHFIGQSDGVFSAREIEHSKVQIILHSAQSSQQVKSSLESVDILLLIMSKSSEHRDTIPAKFFDYIALKKWILIIAPQNSELWNLCKRWNSTCCIDPQNDFDQNFHVLKNWLQFIQKNEYEVMPNNFMQFDLEKLADGLSTLLINLIK